MKRFRVYVGGAQRPFCRRVIAASHEQAQLLIRNTYGFEGRSVFSVEID